MKSENANRTVVPILLYHRVVDGRSRPDRFAVTRTAFDEHMAVVAASGRRAMTVSDYVAERRRLGSASVGDAVLVTFDDGCREFADLALPILERHGIPATMYVVAGLVGSVTTWTKDFGPLMDWDDLRALDESSVSVELGAHSVDHSPLDLLGPEAFNQQVRVSKTILEDRLSRAVHSFAYPFGHHNLAVRRAVVDAGFESACAVKNRLSVPDDDIYALARMTVTPDDDAERIARLLAGDGSRIVTPGERLATTCYRWVRRVRGAVDRRTRW